MVKDVLQRRLAAVLAADVVGYSRLMGQDEAGTLAALKARRKASCRMMGSTGCRYAVPRWPHGATAGHSFR
jgi:hypothetical protein